MGAINCQRRDLRYVSFSISYYCNMSGEVGDIFDISNIDAFSFVYTGAKRHSKLFLTYTVYLLCLSHVKVILFHLFIAVLIDV